MKKNIIFYTFFFGIILNTNSQVTIGMGEEPIPGALLQCKENSVADDGPNSTKGLGFPRVSLTHEGDLRPMFSSEAGQSQKLTHTGLVVYNTNTAAAIDNNSFSFKKGLYVWTGSKWETLDPSVAGGSRWAVTADRTSQPLTDDHKDPVYRPGSVTIGKDDVHTSDAILNIAATDKGVLLPRVALTSPTDKTTIPNPSTGLLVYNTGTGENNKVRFSTKGYMFWNGSEWMLVSQIPSIPPEITKIYCDRATLSPAFFYDNNKLSNQQGYYSGILRIPYDGGNGGWYNKGDKLDLAGTTLGADMTYELQGGQLNNGIGELVFSVKGYPKSNTIRFPATNLIPFYTGTTSCTLAIQSERNAEIRSIATMGVLEYTNDESVPGYYRSLTTPDRKFTIRVFCPTGTTVNNSDLQIRNNMTQTVDVMWSASYSWKGGTNGASANTLELVSNAWAGNRDPGLGSNNSGTTTDYISTRTVAGTKYDGNKNAAWGNEDVYYSNAPEHRSYMWTTKDINDKTFYVLTFMMGAQDSGKSENVANVTKAFLKIDQIHADD